MKVIENYVNFITYKRSYTYRVAVLRSLRKVAATLEMSLVKEKCNGS